MSFNPKMSITSRKLQIIQNQTDQILKALTKEEKTVLRGIRNETIRFRNKYIKLYCKKGFYDMQKRAFIYPIKAPPNYDGKQGICGVHSLIFTKGEIDIHKVLCLHLLTIFYINSTQEIESLKQLLEASKPKKEINKILPNYTVDFYYKSKLEIWPESTTSNKKACFIINNYLENILQIVLDVLQEVSPMKFNQIVQLSKNQTALDEIMQKSKILSLVEKLKDNPLVTDIIHFRAEMGSLINFNSSYYTTDSSDIVCIKIQDARYKFHLVKQEIKKSLRTKLKLGEGSVDLNSTLILLQKLFMGVKNASIDSIITLANKFIDLSCLPELSTEEIALLARMESVLQPKTNSINFIQTHSKLFQYASLHIRNSLYSSTSNNISIIPPNTFTFKARRCLPMNESESERIMQLLLQKLSHAQRILIGKRAAELKSADVNHGRQNTQRASISSLIGDVLTTDSLISLACSSKNEELDLILAPCSRGGLGIGGHVTEKQYESHFTITAPSEDKEHYLTTPVMDMNAIKHDLLKGELSSKVNSFIQTENP